MTRSVAAVVLLFLGLATRGEGQDLGPSLLQNGHFDSSLDGWTRFGFPSEWSMEDVGGSPNSGSARVIAPPISGGTLTQCRSAAPGVRYHYGGKVRYARALSSAATLAATFYDGLDCTGASLGYSTIGLNSSSWQQVRGAMTAPVGTASISVTADVICGMQRLCPTGASVWLDDAFLRAERSLVPLSFHTVPPCRLADSRATGPLRTFRQHALATAGCAVPATARAVSLNVTVTQATAAGDLRLYAADTGVPLTSVANYVPGQTRANNATVTLSGDAELDVYAGLSSAEGSVHVILDVNGYWQ